MSETPDATRTYEFGPLQNETIGRAARWIGLWSWISIGGGLLLGAGSLVQRMAESSASLSGIILGLVYVLIGIYFRGAARAMTEVVRTRGNDIAHLLSALDRLASAFQVMVVLVGIGITSTVVLALLALAARGA